MKALVLPNNRIELISETPEERQILTEYWRKPVGTISCEEWREEYAKSSNSSNSKDT